MNEHRLYVNGQQVKLVVDKPLAYTMQVNDIGDIANRQANFTRTIDIPYTPENKLIFEFLGDAGTTTNLPYNKLIIDYYVGNDCLIYQGWGQVTESNKNGYKLNVYDGVIDLFKAIENKSLADLDLEDINHDKSLTTVTDSWVNNYQYKYILADYNGKAKYDGSKYNIDYIVPSAKVSYIFNQIFEYANATYEGDIFQTADFDNLYMTYPKGVVTVNPDETDPVMTGNTFNFLGPYTSSPTRRFLKFTGSPTIIGGQTSVQSNQIHVNINESGTYKIRVRGKFRYTAYQTNQHIGAALAIAYNADPNITSPQSVGLGASSYFHNALYYDTWFDNEKTVALNAGDTFCLIVSSAYQIIHDEGSVLLLELNKLTTNEINFNNALADFKMTDFLKEVTWRYGLTIFKDKYTNNYRFLTLDERINQAERIDWSKKFQGVKTEKYIYGTYAQQNQFHHKYNDDNSDYMDGIIEVHNKNLADNKKVIESKLFAPERAKNINDFQFESNIYKLWDKEVTENEGTQEIEYKELDKRFYFLKSEDYTFSPSVTVGSEGLIQSTTITTAPIETFEEVRYSYVVDEYYRLISNIISRAKIITAQFHLTSTDINNFDFAKLYYIDQLGGYFFVNKISNWQDGKLTNVEIIKLENDIEIPNISGSNGGYDTSDGNAPYITITNYQVINIDAWVKHIVIDFETNITSSQLKVYGNPIPNSSPYTYVTTSTGFPSPHTLAITSLDETVISNSITWWG